MPDLRRLLSIARILPILSFKQRKNEKRKRQIGMNFRRALALAATIFLATGPVVAQEPVWHGGISTIGELKYKDGFARFDYVNPDAPKGGDLRLSQPGPMTRSTRSFPRAK
jgi:hypothetical protein